jgi:hypothetical protein
MIDTYKVVVERSALAEYLAKGYTVAEVSVATHLGKAWILLPPEQRDSLVLVEIDALKHARLSQPETAFVCQLDFDYVCVGARVVKLDVLERSEADRCVYASPVNSEDARTYSIHDVQPTAREAALLCRDRIIQTIAELADYRKRLEHFLVAQDIERG